MDNNKNLPVELNNIHIFNRIDNFISDFLGLETRFINSNETKILGSMKTDTWVMDPIKIITNGWTYKLQPNFYKD